MKNSECCTSNRVRSFQDLQFGEQFIVWAVRAWTHNRECDCGNQVDIKTGFRVMQLETALPMLAAFLETTRTAADRRIELHGVSCCGVSHDEALLIQCIASLQMGYLATAHRLLHDFLPCAAARSAVWTLDAFAHRLVAAGVVLPQDEPFDNFRSSQHALQLDSVH
jgi:hypothetical protein